MRDKKNKEMELEDLTKAIFGEKKAQEILKIVDKSEETCPFDDDIDHIPPAQIEHWNKMIADQIAKNKKSF